MQFPYQSFALLSCAAVGKPPLTTVAQAGGNRGTGLKKVISWSLFITAGQSGPSDLKETCYDFKFGKLSSAAVSLFL